MELVNEILQWIVIVYSIWAIYLIGKSVRMTLEIIKEMNKTENGTGTTK